MEARKNARKKQYRESRRLVRSLTDVTKRLKNKLVKETAARKKAEASALLLSQRIKKMSHFGKKAAKFAKKQAVKAASIKKKAAQDTAKLLAKHAKLEGKAKEFLAR